DLRKAEGILAQKLDDARDEGIKIGKEKGREEGIQIGEERGIKIGAEKGKIEVAKNLLKAGVSIDIIAQTTGLPKAEIAQLKEEVTS
ncbi:MAG: transposase, partial [Wolbachia endosymbiont of Melophagus ovinus]|nr:transposase [Wolbachia endosymbiont of Melophagus ovinus]